MILKFELSEKNRQLLELSEKEEIYYTLPLDLDSAGNYLKNSYVVITNRTISILEEGKLHKKYSLSECEEIKSEPQIACGILYVVRSGTEEFLGRFSSKHLARFSYAARGAMLLKQGKTQQVESQEYEKTCLVCGRALPGTKLCPHCAGKKVGLLHELFVMLKPYKLQLLIILFLMLAASAITLLNPEIQKYLIDDILNAENGTLQQAFICLGGMFGLSIGIVIVNISKSYLCSKLGSTISMDLRKKLYAKIQILSLSFINDRRPGELMNRIINDTGRIREFMEDVFCNLFTVVIIFVFDIVYMLILDVKLALLAFVFAPVSVFVSVAFWKNIHRRFHRQWVKNDDIYSQLQDVISGMSVVKSYGKEKEESLRFDQSAGEYADIQSKNEVFWAIFYPVLSFVMGAGVFFILYFGGSDVLSGNKTAGELLQFVNYTSMLYMYLNWITNLPRQLMNLITSVQRIGDVMSQEPQIYDRENAAALDLKGEIEFKDLSFGYK